MAEGTPDVLVVDEAVEQHHRRPEDAAGAGPRVAAVEVAYELLRRPPFGPGDRVGLARPVGGEPVAGQAQREGPEAHLVAVEDVADDVPDPPPLAEGGLLPVVVCDRVQVGGEVGVLFVVEAPVVDGDGAQRWSMATLMAPVSPWRARVAKASRHRSSGNVWVSMADMSTRPCWTRSR